MPELYEIAILGSPSEKQINAVKEQLVSGIEPFGLTLGKDVRWLVCSSEFKPAYNIPSCVAFFGGEGVSVNGVASIMQRGTPIVPVVSALSRVSLEIPEILQPLNCLPYEENGAQRIATALLECVGLLPRQRRVFVSYRRTESREAALQLFDALSARHFDVFLDTHGIGPGEDFQAMLWHRLCDSDVLLMLDTPGYFDSRWSSAEFGRALAKGISVLRVGWPSLAVSPMMATASDLQLADSDLQSENERLVDTVLEKICLQVEALRSQSHAVRELALFSQISMALERLGCTVSGAGTNRTVFARLRDGRKVMVHPSVGVPTSRSLHEAVEKAPDCSVAVVYDEVGLHPEWLKHLTWLGNHIKAGRYVQAHRVAWDLADWVTK